MTTDDERLAAIRAKVDDLEEIVWLLALVDRLKAERDETQAALLSGIDAGRLAQAELRARAAKLERVVAEARDVCDNATAIGQIDDAVRALDIRALREALAALDGV